MTFLLVTELLLIFVLLPSIIALGILPRNPLPYLWIGSACALYYLAKYSTIEIKSFWTKFGSRQEIVEVICRLIVATAVLIPAALVFLNSDQLCYLPRQKPLLWGIIIVLYPIISAYPQGLIYRAFFHERYKIIFASPLTQMIASALLFGYGHIIFRNFLAIILATIGGLIFYRTYKKTNSLLLSSFEHAYYGLLVFTLGFGRFFYHGYVQ